MEFHPEAHTYCEVGDEQYHVSDEGTGFHPEAHTYCEVGDEQYGVSDDNRENTRFERL